MPDMVAALSVKIITFVLVRATIRVVRHTSISALVEEGHKMADAEKVKVSLLAQVYATPIESINFGFRLSEPSV